MKNRLSSIQWTSFVATLVGLLLVRIQIYKGGSTLVFGYYLAIASFVVFFICCTIDIVRNIKASGDKDK